MNLKQPTIPRLQTYLPILIALYYYDEAIFKLNIWLCHVRKYISRKRCSHLDRLYYLFYWLRLFKIETPAIPGISRIHNIPAMAHVNGIIHKHAILGPAHREMDYRLLAGRWYRR